MAAPMSDKKKKGKTRKKEKTEKPAKMVTLESTQMWSPVKDVLDGIVITKDGRYVQILEFSPINFRLRPEYERLNIADTFGAAIRIFPDKFQIKILSRKANVESHVKDLERYMKEETNELCQRMQMETIRLIQKNGSAGVSKRFLLSFAYEQPLGLRRPSWSDIRTSLYQKSYQIASRLEGDPCNNELLSPPHSTDYTLGLLYDCMNRTEAEMKSLDTKIDDVVCTYLLENRLKEENMTIPINDFLVPQCIDPSISPNYLYIDGKYHAYGYIPKQAYPLECYPGWLSILIDMGEGMDVDIWVEKQPKEKVLQSLTSRMNWTRADMQSKDESAADLDILENKIASGKYIRAGLNNDQTFLYFTIMISVVAPSPEELKRKLDWVNTHLVTNNLKLRMLKFRHNDAFRMSLPLCSPDERIFKKGARNILSGDFSAMYPFTSYEINDRGGIMLGTNQLNFSPVFINQFDNTQYTNGNMAIFGSSGSGKTYMLQCLALRLRQQQVHTVIIAPYKGHEYRRTCEAIGGQFITIAPGSPQNINIMEIRKYDTTNKMLLDGEDINKQSILAQKITQLHTFFSLLLKNEPMTPIETQELDEALIRTYRNKGITKSNKSLIDPHDRTRYKEMPVLGDLMNELRKSKDTARLRSVLTRFVTGSASSFNAQTNVNLDNPYVVIDVSEMSEDLLPIGIFIATDFVSDVVKADRIQKKAIFWDELHRLIGPAGSKEAGKYVLSCWKLFRGYRAVCICATQDSNDFLSQETGDIGKGILASSKLKVVMKVERMEARSLAEVMDLSAIEEQEIQNFKRGEALLIANRNHARIKITASSLEHDIITTDPAQLERQLYHIRQRKETFL